MAKEGAFRALFLGEFMKLKVLKQFSHFRLGAFVSGESIEVPDEYASHLIEIGVAESASQNIKAEEKPIEVVTNGNKRTRNSKS